MTRADATLGTVIFAAAAAVQPWVASDPLVHMLVQFPLLGGVGFALGRRISLPERWTGAAVIIGIATVFFWMLPRSLDSALTSWTMHLAKFTTLPLAAGLPLTLAWPRLSVAGELSYYDPLTTEYLGGNAVEWYPKVHALFRLGEAYLKGQGITKDKEKARVCFKIPAENFHDKAKEYLALLKYDLELMEENNKPSIFERSTLDIIAAGENEEIEYKETFSLNTRTGQNNDKKIRYATVREIAGFLNSRDGVLLIGVSDAQIVTGVECDGFEGNGDKYTLKINDVIRSAIGDAATGSCVTITFDMIVDKTVCRIECKKSKKPVYCTYQGDEKLFIRIGSSTKEPKPSEWDKWKEDNFD